MLRRRSIDLDGATMEIEVRRVQFDWSRVPMHWLPGEPVVAQVINATHVLLPPGERWFVRVCAEALPSVTDARLRRDVTAFMRQEALHGRSHGEVLACMARAGVDASSEVAALEATIETEERLARRWFGERRFRKGRVAVVAATEHFTAVLGNWALCTSALASGDPTMVDLLLWHAAEEVEHRSVAFDLATVLTEGRMRWRWVGLGIASASLLFWWVRVVRFIAKRDPALARRGITPLDYWRAQRRGLLPGRELVRAMLTYLRPGFHPREQGGDARARAYLAGSPAVRAARATETNGSARGAP